jgi:hypothetical protein
MVRCRFSFDGFDACGCRNSHSFFTLFLAMPSNRPASTVQTSWQRARHGAQRCQQRPGKANHSNKERGTNNRKCAARQSPKLTTHAPIAAHLKLQFAVAGSSWSPDPQGVVLACHAERCCVTVSKPHRSRHALHQTDCKTQVMQAH